MATDTSVSPHAPAYAEMAMIIIRAQNAGDDDKFRETPVPERHPDQQLESIRSFRLKSELAEPILAQNKRADDDDDSTRYNHHLDIDYSKSCRVRRSNHFKQITEHREAE